MCDSGRLEIMLNGDPILLQAKNINIIKLPNINMNCRISVLTTDRKPPNQIYTKLKIAEAIIDTASGIPVANFNKMPMLRMYGAGLAKNNRYMALIIPAAFPYFE